MRRRNTLARVLLAAAMLAACKDGEGPPVPGSITAAAGNQQAAAAGTVLPTAPAVVVKDTKGRPMNGVTVTFAVSAGGGALGGTTIVKTTPDGVARTGAWTLGTTAGPQKLAATVQGLPVFEFTATANAGAPATIQVVEGDGQSASVGSAVAVAPAVTVKDNFGNPVPNETVTFTATVGGGQIVGAAAMTDATGTARVGSWTLGTASGLNTLTATTSNGTSLTFTAIATAGAATQMAIFGGDHQSISINGTLPVRPSVIVRDQFNNPVSGVVVVFTVASGGGSVTGAVQTTGTAGIASVGSWQIGSSTGHNTLTAQSAGLNSVTFTATGLEPQVFTMSVSAGNNQSAPAGWTVGVAPAVVIRDQYGTPASGVGVTFAIASGGGTLTGLSATTDANGVAKIGWWRLGASPGANTLTASANALSPVTFSATALTPPPSSGYEISIAYLTPPTARQHQAVLNAVTRWQQVITGDLSDFTNFSFGATGCSPAFVNETIDDILVQVDFSFIDGPSNILGQAGPCLIRGTNALTAVGRLKIDAADLANMENNGTIDDVLLHEIGHILGIGALWTHPNKGLLSFANTDSTTFTGAAAAGAFLASGGIGFPGQPVPAENCKNATGNPIGGCGSGTRDAHWREAVLGRELMTGYISPSGVTNPLSAITVQSLADLGYTVNAGVADSFTVGLKPIPGAEPIPIFLHEAKPNWSMTTIPGR